MRPTPEPIVTCEDVTKHYARGDDRVIVLDGIDLDVPAGSFVSLMGPSGSGKTTLLNLIGGLDHPSSGRLRVAGLSLAETTPRELAKWRAARIGFIFQFYNLLPVLSAQRNVELPLLLTGLSAREREHHAALALEIVGLADRRKHRPAELSGGQQQRVAIARAIVADPDLLVCDEPTGDLDRIAADETMELLGSLHREHGKSIIMVTHDPKAAAHAGTRLQMDKGRLINAPSEPGEAVA